ncbi:MAG: hypothetical protein DME10_27570 [Candidatus Rokuibacteriota bacterium]|nr:MAG: hypothetical protein DME10_27570 [Candidatus Rokubacteria bacterium]
MGERDVEIEDMLFLNSSPLWGEGRSSNRDAALGDEARAEWVRGRFSCARITIAMLPIERE